MFLASWSDFLFSLALPIALLQSVTVLRKQNDTSLQDGKLLQSISSGTDRPTQLSTGEPQSCFQRVPAAKPMGPASQQASRA